MGLLYLVPNTTESITSRKSSLLIYNIYFNFTAWRRNEHVEDRPEGPCAANEINETS